mgnify:CR=1 FL=1
MPNTPRSREKNITGQGAGVQRRGEGTGQGQVGGGSYMSGGNAPKRDSGGSPQRSSGGGGLLKIVIAAAVLLLGGGGGLSAFLGNSSDSGTGDDYGYVSQETGNQGSGVQVTGSSFGSLFSGISGTSTGWEWQDNRGNLNTKIAKEAREKYTSIKGNGNDIVTIMVYMCGTDLESKSGMATNDLNEMAKATIADNVNIIVYTGGCKQWKTSFISSQYNQIYKVESGGLKKLVDNDGNAAMTNPDTLTNFIRFCKENYPADRNMLIFWDHGGGSVSGYGYDEKNASAGSMSLAGINTALKNAGIKYDFIGFDACLMATVETALMTGNYADYLIASEETEPGVGWYYTNWLTKLSQNTSMDTLEIGKNIVDDFVEVCAQTCRGQKTTLSVIDLAELTQTVGDDFKAFSTSTTELVKDSQYKVVSDARSNSREFASSSKIDQIDLVDFASRVGTDEGKELAETLLSAVKYNRTSSNMTNAYGISIYFPYKKSSTLSSAVKTYDQIGLDKEYSDCIKEFTSLQLSGQAATGGTGGTSSVNPLEILLGGSSQGNSAQTLDSIFSLISAFSSSGSSGGLTDIFSGRSLSDQDRAEYVLENRLDASKLLWQRDAEGRSYIALDAADWGYVHSVDLNMYYDDGTGYIDLGLDNTYEISDDGKLYADTDGTWLSINNQPVAYYHTDTVDDGADYSITGYVPAMLNGERVKLILIFDNANPYGYVAGADPDYDESQTLTLSRGLVEIKDGDKIDFLCDYYRYDGTFDDSYYLGKQLTVNGGLTISDTYLNGSYIALYKFTDIYDQGYFSEKLPE